MTSVRDSDRVGVQAPTARSRRDRRGQRAGQGAGDGPVRRHPRRGWPRRACDAAGTARADDAPPAPGRGARRRGRRQQALEADVVLIATGADPRVLPGAEPDGERILDWRDVYDLRRCPSTSSSSAPASPARSSPPATSRPGSRSPWSPPATGCCPARTPTPPRSCRRSSSARGGRIAERGRAAARAPHREGRASSSSPTAATVEGSHALMTVGTVPNTAGSTSRSAACGSTPSRARRRRPGLPHLGRPASTPPATSPASSSSPRSPPCRAGSPCGTRSARR